MKFKHLLFVLGLISMLFLMISCDEKIELKVDVLELTMTEGDLYTIDLAVSHKDGVIFSASDQSVISVNENGLVEAISEGVAKIKIEAVVNREIFIEVTITVLKKIELNVITDDITFIVGDQHSIEYNSNDNVTFSSSNETIVTVDDQGHLIALQAGNASVTVTSTYDLTKSKTINITVLNLADTVMITGHSIVNLNTSTTYELVLEPIDSAVRVTWHVSNPSIANISDDGVLTTIDTGQISIIIKLENDDTTLATFEVEIVNFILVDASATLNDKITYENLTFVYGERLFSSLQDAVNQASVNTTIFIYQGHYQNDFHVETDGLTFIGIDLPTIDSNIQIDANHISFMNIKFNNNSLIEGHNQSDFTFKNNLIQNMSSSTPFIYLSNFHKVDISNNVFHLNNQHAIILENVTGSTIIVYKNEIRNAKTAISISVAHDADELTSVQVTRNDIEQVEVGMIVENDFNLGYAYVRFNAVSNYTLFAAKSNENSTVEFTLNYWGEVDLNLASFSNINPLYLRGHYATKQAIITEAQYNPALPVKIIITSTIEQIDLGETFTITYDLLPMDLETDRIRFITSNPDVLIVNQNGTITPVKSGQATITVRSSVNFSINAQFTIVVTTEPGIELKPSNIENNLIVGDTFTLLASPFPTEVNDEAVFFFSSDDDIATIDETGVVTTHKAGVVTFHAWLLLDETVTNSITMQVFDTLDESDLLDILTVNQLNFAYPREWLALGVGHNFRVNTYESVSRYHFGDIPINTSKMLPVFYAIRPGEPMTPHPVGITPFNPYHVYWVVIHDTANTSPGSGALAHANYLYNNTVNQNALWVSWHFTIDDRLIYQHVPEIERAFHAGDGSVLVGQHSVYLGGGNRNGIGIEMAVNQDSDMYKTWQRTAKLVADLLVRYNLPRDHMKYHRDFSGKTCPNTLINAGLLPHFEIFADIEYRVRKDFNDAEIIFESHNLEYLDDHGRIIKLPDRAMTISYTITVTHNDITRTRTFYSYLPGTLT